MEKIIGGINLKKPDQSFADFLAGFPGIWPEVKQLAKDFVEGFNAARVERISVHSLAKDQQASERIEGDQSFRVLPGYRKIIDWLEEQLQSKNVPVHHGVKIETLRWKRGAASLDAQTADGKRTFEAARAIITLPLGVLKSGDVKFDP